MNSPVKYEPGQWQVMKEQATMLVRSGFLPESVNTPEKAIAIAMKGQEIGMPMMQAYSQIHVIKGKPTLSAEGINSLIRRNCPGAKLEFLERTEEQCIIKATRPLEAPAMFSFTMADAKRAGITNNPSWTKYPRQMLFARCISEVGRTMFPDCLSGISYVPEELGADVDENGEVISVPVEKVHPVVTATMGFDPNNATQVKYMTKWCHELDIKDEKDILEIMKRMTGKTSEDMLTTVKEYENELKAFAQGEEK